MDVASFFHSSLCAHMYMNVCVCVCVIPGGLVAKNLPANAGNVNSIPGWQGTLEEEMATNSSSILTIDRGSWQATIHGIDESGMTEWLSMLTHVPVDGEAANFSEKKTVKSCQE